MSRSLNEILSTQISRLKGSDFTIDRRIGFSYLVSVVLERVLMAVRGFIRFPLRRPRPFIGSGARIRSGGNLTFGSSVTFGHHSFVDALSRDGVTFGNNVSVGRNTRIECTGSLRSLGKGMTVGDNVGLGTDSFYGCAGGIEIGSETIVGNFVSFHSENHNMADNNIPIRLQGVSHLGITVGPNCWIGAKVTVLDGAVIEEGCVIAAGAVVKSGNYPAGGIYGGIPARLLGSRTADQQ